MLLWCGTEWEWEWEGCGCGCGCERGCGRRCECGCGCRCRRRCYQKAMAGMVLHVGKCKPGGLNVRCVVCYASVAKGHLSLWCQAAAV